MTKALSTADFLRLVGVRPEPFRPDTMASLWTGSERHIASEVSYAMRGTCHRCGRSPARVYLRHHLLCGVCWSHVGWLRWAQEELSR